MGERGVDLDGPAGAGGVVQHVVHGAVLRTRQGFECAQPSRAEGRRFYLANQRAYCCRSAFTTFARSVTESENQSGRNCCGDSAHESTSRWS